MEKKPARRTRTGELGRLGSAARNDWPEITKLKRTARGKEEIASWFRIWLENPDAFFDWLDVRKQSPDFARKFTQDRRRGMSGPPQTRLSPRSLLYADLGCIRTTHGNRKPKGVRAQAHGFLGACFPHADGRSIEYPPQKIPNGHRRLKNRLRVRSFLFFYLGKFLAEVGDCFRTSSQSKTRPDFSSQIRNQAGDFFFFPRACALSTFVISGNHFRAALPSRPNFQYAFGGRFFSMRLESPLQFIETHQADFRVTQRFEVQQVLEFLFKLVFGFSCCVRTTFHPADCRTSAM